MIFKLKGYDGFADTDWIRVRDLTLFVGENDAGKTRVMRALSLLGSDEDTLARAGLKVESHADQAYTISTLDVTPERMPQHPSPDQVVRDLIANGLVSDDLNTLLLEHVGYTIRQEGGTPIFERGDGVSFHLEDVSHGIVQFTSLLLRASRKLHDQDGTPFVVVNPEQLLHPKMQAKLADLFVTMCDPPGDHAKHAVRCLVETHSKALLENLGVLVDGGVISAKKISVLMFERVGGICTVRETEFNDEGILQDWTVGFMSW